MVRKKLKDSVAAVGEGSSSPPLPAAKPMTVSSVGTISVSSRTPPAGPTKVSLKTGKGVHNEILLEQGSSSSSEEDSDVEAFGDVSSESGDVAEELQGDDSPLLQKVEGPVAAQEIPDAPVVGAGSTPSGNHTVAEGSQKAVVSDKPSFVSLFRNNRDLTQGFRLEHVPAGKERWVPKGKGQQPVKARPPPPPGKVSSGASPTLVTSDAPPGNVPPPAAPTPAEPIQVPTVVPPSPTPVMGPEDSSALRKAKGSVGSLLDVQGGLRRHLLLLVRLRVRAQLRAYSAMSFLPGDAFRRCLEGMGWWPHLFALWNGVWQSYAAPTLLYSCGVLGIFGLEIHVFFPSSG
ncbi:hypothetical protein K2173_018443 [Erythroxylum novogranatense]|uniref:Uncharacterized protein n=1 Tax=Erythroxylum novogranatense TaxID=1862640 RepID=A0AAV8UBS4_9ROSI|nr:hypothetical protein K2173_018443 [Erythroxylum novogranatense]